MIRKFKPLILTGFFIVFSLWWFGGYNQSPMEEGYTPRDFALDVGKIFYDLGCQAQERGDFVSAINSFNTAIVHVPDYLEAYDKLGICHENLGHKDVALKLYLKAISINPNFIETRICNGCPVPVFAPDRELLQERTEWVGQPLQGKTIYVFAEKGFGETFQFVRFLPLLVKEGATVLFKPQGSVTDLIKQANLGVTLVDECADPATLSFDFYASLLSIANFLEVSYKTIPTQKGYLIADTKKAEEFKQKLFATYRIKIGLVWQGDKNHINDKNRSIPLSLFYDIARSPGVQCYSLQKGYGLEQLAHLPSGVVIVNLDDQLKNFADTAAAICNLDVVITVDTAIAHLAGAIGKPVWVLLPYVADWCWFGYSEDSRSIWYNSMKKFKQTSPGDWVCVFKKVKKELARLINGK